MLRVGDVLEDKYRIVRFVGAGGMGSVFEAEHTFLARRVAVKVLGAEYAYDADAVRRFRREAQAAARVGHDNICEVLDVGGTPDGQPFIVMQLLQGRSLAAAIAEDGLFEVGRAVDIVVQVLEGLAAAHEAGIIHRDMKPDNVFLTRLAGREDFVKILDFGISKIRSAGDGEAGKITQTGAVLGSPLYMSPEQAQGETEIDLRSDVWSVGMIAYEMLTGKCPFDGPNCNRILFNVLTVRIVPPAEARPGLPIEVGRAVMGALERDRACRYPSCDAFREALLDAWARTDEGSESGLRRRAGPDRRRTDGAPGATRLGVAATMPMAPFAPTEAVSPADAPSPGPGPRVVVRARPTADVTPDGATLAASRPSRAALRRGKRRSAAVVAVATVALAVGAYLLLARSPGEPPDPSGPPGAAAEATDLGAALPDAAPAPAPSAHETVAAAAVPATADVASASDVPDTAAPEAPSPPGPVAEGPAAGLPFAPSAEDVATRLETVRAAVRQCTGGRVAAVDAALTLEGATGRVSEVEVSGPTGAAGDCVRAVLAGVAFPAFAAEVRVVRHRYEFETRRPAGQADAGSDAATGRRPTQIDEHYPLDGTRETADAGTRPSVHALPDDPPF